MTQDTSAKAADIKSVGRAEKKKSRARIHKSPVVIDEIVNHAVASALQSPKISLYSPLLLGVLESQQLSLFEPARR